MVRTLKLKSEEEINDLEWRVSNDDRSPRIKLSDIYFKPKFFERSGRIYELFGVKYFKDLIMNTVGRKLRKSKGYYPNTYFIGEGNKKDISAYETKARRNELIHAPMTIYFASSLAYNIAEGDTSQIIISGVFALLNGYCTMLQRYNRARAYKILEKRGER